MHMTTAERSKEKPNEHNRFRAHQQARARGAAKSAAQIRQEIQGRDKGAAGEEGSRQTEIGRHQQKAQVIAMMVLD
jgi:hypothetical protein